MFHALSFLSWLQDVLPMGYIPYTLITVTSLHLSIPVSVSVSVSVFEFAQIVLQVYRDKNLCFNLDLRTPSLSNIHLNLDLRTPSLSSLYLSLDLRNFEPFECQYPPYALRLNFFRLLCFTCSPSALFSARDEH